MQFRLTRHDEYPRHQIGATFDVLVSESPHWSDGYYFTFGDPAGEVACFSGFRLYANNDVLDAFSCVSTSGRQHNMRFSRRLRPRIDDLECGPFTVEIVEGLRTLRTAAAPNPYGISYELEWRGVTPPYNEEHVQHYVNGRVVADRSNYDQACTVHGWLAVGDRRWDVDGWTGVRDHSWGIGSTGGPRSKSAAPAVPNSGGPAAYATRVWCVFRFPKRVVFWQFHRGRDGSLPMFESHSLAPYDADPSLDFAYTGVAEQLNIEQGHRLVDGVIALTKPDGGVDRFRIERLSYPIYMQGGGYWNGFDDGLGRGVYRGDAHGEGEVWDVSHPTRIIDPKGVLRARPDAYAELWGRATNLDDPTETGDGHLECVVAV